MGRKIIHDLVGQKIARLTVLQKTKKNGRLAYVCQCDCGNTVVISSSQLNAGHAKSCGCLKKEIAGAKIEAAKEVNRDLARLEREGKKPKGSLCLDCIRSAAPPELQCIWDKSIAKEMPAGAEAFVYESTNVLDGKKIYITSCPEFLSLYDTNNQELLKDARKRNAIAIQRLMRGRMGESISCTIKL